MSDGVSRMNASDFRVCLEKKLSSAIGSVKGFIFTSIIFFIAMLVTSLLVARTASGGSSSGTPGLGIVILALSIIFMLTIFINIIFSVFGILNSGNLVSVFNFYKSCVNDGKLSRILDPVYAANNIRVCLCFNLAISIVASVIMSMSWIMGAFAVSLGLFLLILVWKYKNDLVGFRDKGLA